MSSFFSLLSFIMCYLLLLDISWTEGKRRDGKVINALRSTTFLRPMLTRDKNAIHCLCHCKCLRRNKERDRKLHCRHFINRLFIFDLNSLYIYSLDKKVKVFVYLYFSSIAIKYNHFSSLF